MTEKINDPLKFREWLNRGIDAGWITEPNCWTHDTFDLTEEEEKEFDDGGDPCILMVRLWM